MIPKTGRRHAWLSRSLSLAALGALISPATVFAQSLDRYGEPYFQTLSLSAGFSNDPRTVSVRAGGASSASGLGDGCSGSMGSRPDVRLHYSAGTVLPLNIYATSADDDLTLVVLQPNGTWTCSDDYDGLDPAVLLPKPMSGEYNIWVGVFGGGFGDGTLYISELTPDFGDVAASDDFLDVGAEPLYATLRLSSGFADDPRAVSLRAGGAMDVGNLADGCRGSVDAAPHVRVNYTSGSTLPLNFYAMSADEDVTLVINRPDGSWICNDDYSGSDPAVLISSPASGQYDVWVGVYGGGTASATLYVSELSPNFNR